jgi:outer membrane cobalamin receptor
MRFSLLVVMVLRCLMANGQIDTIPFINSKLGIQTLLDLDSLNDGNQATVATYLRLPIRETPSIVSVLTEVDIKQSGARDLRELLMLLPGIDFEVDVQNNLGIGIRGLWGVEGKVLVLWDGNVMNETAYGSFSFNQHIFLGNIERIEVIRGPGSAIYGGMAGLAVINITSKNYAESYTNGFISQTIGSSSNRLSQQIWQCGLGNKWKKGFSLNVTGTFAKANISNRMEKKGINYADSSAIDTQQLGIQGQYKNLDFSVLYDGHTQDIIDGPGRTLFSGWYGQINYRWKISEKLTLFPTIRLKIQEPWNYEGVPGPLGDSVNTLNHRYTTGLRFQFEPNNQVSLITGLEYFLDDAIFSLTNQFFSNGKDRVAFTNLAAFAQGIYKTKWINLTAGARIDMHSAFGPAFVPRVGITRMIRQWHIKAIYSKAFKAPNIITLDANPTIKPERISTAEIETGYQTKAGLSINANVFYTMVNNPIIYSSVNGFDNEYINGDYISAAGGEIAMGLHKAWGKLSANYSFYRTVSNRVPEFEVANQSSKFLGFPQHKLAGNASVTLSKQMALSTSLIFQSNKYFYNNDNQLSFKPGIAQLNVSFSKRNLFYNGLSVDAGVYNVLNQNLWYVIPYKIEANTTPQMGREFILKLTFQLNR